MTRCFAGRFAGVQLCTDDSIIDVLAVDRIQDATNRKQRGFFLHKKLNYLTKSTGRYL